jgi:hypothetical protein
LTRSRHNATLRLGIRIDKGLAMAETAPLKAFWQPG